MIITINKKFLITNEENNNYITLLPSFIRFQKYQAMKKEDLRIGEKQEEEIISYILISIWLSAFTKKFLKENFYSQVIISRKLKPRFAYHSFLSGCHFMLHPTLQKKMGGKQLLLECNHG